MPDVLILYASKHGHTAKIAAAVANALCIDGLTTHLEDIASASEITPASYDAVVVGASVHAGHHQREIADWARAHAATLSAMPSAFFSVSLTVAEGTGEAEQTALRLIDEFIEQTGWTPGSTASFAGALQYLEYDVVTRLIMRLMMRRGHHPTDTSRNYDYTDWKAVEGFAHECSAAFTGAGRVDRSVAHAGGRS